MSGVSLASDSLGLAIREQYEEVLQVAFNSGDVLLDQLVDEFDQKEFDGTTLRVIRVRTRAGGQGGRTEYAGVDDANAAMPTHGARKRNRAEYGLVSLYARSYITGQAMDAAKSGAVAVAADQLAESLEETSEDAREDFVRQLYHDGSGILTNCGVTTASVNVIVSSTLFIREGAVIDIITVATGAVVASARTVVSIDSETQITISGAGVTTAATDAIVLTNTYTGTTDRTVQAVWGLLALINDVNPGKDTAAGAVSNFGSASTKLLGGIDRTADPTWKSFRVTESSTGGGGGITDALDAWQKAYYKWNIAAEPKRPPMILVPEPVSRHYASVLTPLRRFGDEVELNGGWKGLKFADAALMVGRLCTNPNVAKNEALADFDYAFFIHPQSIAMAIQRDWSFLKDDQGGILRLVTGASGEYDAWQWALCTRRQFIAKNPKLSGILDAFTA